MWTPQLVSCALVGALVLPSGQVMAQSPKYTISADVVYGHKDGMALTFDLATPSAATGGAVIYIVSAGWTSQLQPPEQFVRNFEGLLGMGFSVFIVRHGS